MATTTTAAPKVAKEATAKVEEFAAEAQKTFTEGMEKVTKNFEGLSQFGQETVDAMLKTSELAAKAAEGIGSEISAYSKKSFEDTVAAAQDFASAKTVTELFEKQSAFVQSAFEGFLAQTTKMNEIYLAAAKEVSAPLTSRMSAAAGLVKGYAA
jgi:phasin family protein